MKKKSEKKQAKAEQKRLANEETARNDKARAYFEDEVIPIVSWNEDLDVGIMEDGTIIDILGIVSKNLASASDNEVSYDILNWDKIFKTFPKDLKILCFNFPTDTTVQQEYIDKIQQRTLNPIYKEQLQTKKAELETISSTRKDREFAIAFYAKNIDDYKTQYVQLYSLLTHNNPPLAYKLSKEKKQKIVYSLFNKCTSL